MADKFSLSEMVAEEIRVLLTRRRMSARRLAADLGFSQSAMSARLTGTTPIDLNELARIADILDVDVTALIPQREGKLIAVGGTSRPSRPESKPWKNLARSTGPHPVGPPSRTAPSALRTGRVNRALVAA